MPLPKPTLDTRTFDQLVAEGRALIPRLAKRWTDHNASDPGITLLELGAWLSEQNFYRFDRITTEAERAFLRLTGVTPRPPEVAHTVVSVQSAHALPVALPGRMQLADTAGNVSFETVEPLMASPARLMQVLVGRPPLMDCTRRNQTPYDPARVGEGDFDAFGPKPHRGAALYLGFDRAPGQPGDVVSLYAWTTTPERDAAARAALVAEWEALRADVIRACPCTPEAADRVPDWRRHYWARTVWEYFRAGGGAGGKWAPLEVMVDETRALTLSGFIRFKAPDDAVAGGPGPHFFIRCRPVAGRFECAPRLDCIANNAVRVEHAVTMDPELLATSRGHASERLTVLHAPIVAGSTQLTLVEDGSADTAWQEVLEWDQTGAHERVYRLDPESGIIQFGNGLRGVPAPAGAKIVLSYRRGGGPIGNLRARTLVRFDAGARNQSLLVGWSALAPGFTIAQPVAAFGGAPAESMQRAKARAVKALATVHKAVTPADFELLALSTPGVAVGRAKALTDTHPSVPCYRAAGSVTVVIIPRCPGPHPLPSRAMLGAVQAFIHRRRLVTSELHLIAPHYVRVTVHGTLHAELGVDAAALAAQAKRAIDGYFNPLTGEDGQGWPIGRAVYRTEVMALLAQLPGVLRVTGLGLHAKGDTEPRCGNLEICAYDLIMPGRHRIEVRLSRPGEQLTRSDAHECECP
jgi:predicted phage baseplate assembly protein